MPATLATIGIQSATEAVYTQIDFSRATSQTVIQDLSGNFAQAHAFDPIDDWSVKGSGYPTIAVAEASDGGISDLSGGKSICTNTKYTQNNENYDSFECSGKHFPSAT